MSITDKMKEQFIVTTELGPVKGAQFEASLEKAKAYTAGLDAINVHDCPMASLRINASVMAGLIQSSLNIEAIPHFTCRDRSLLGTQADLLGAHAMGIRNLLVTTGDPPKHGPYPSKAVYDYGTLDLIRLIRKMNSGLDHNDKEFGGQTDFKIACTAMPTAKKIDAELERMAKKIEAGAVFFQTQVVYDAPRVIPFLKQAREMNTPVLLGIMPLKSPKMARYMNDNVDGIDVPEEIISSMEAGSKSGIEIACEMVREIHPYVDGIHIMAMGDINGTNRIIEFIRNLPKKAGV